MATYKVKVVVAEVIVDVTVEAKSPKQAYFLAVEKSFSISHEEGEIVPLESNYIDIDRIRSELVNVSRKKKRLT